MTDYPALAIPEHGRLADNIAQNDLMGTSRANAASLVLHLEDLRRAADKPNTPEHDHAVA